MMRSKTPSSPAPLSLCPPCSIPRSASTTLVPPSPTSAHLPPPPPSVATRTPLECSIEYLLTVLYPWEARQRHFTTSRNTVPSHAKQASSSTSDDMMDLGATSHFTLVHLSTTPSPFFASLAEPSIAPSSSFRQSNREGQTELSDMNVVTYVQVMRELVNLEARERALALAGLLRAAKASLRPERTQELEDAAFFLPGKIGAVPRDTPSAMKRRRLCERDCTGKGWAREGGHEEMEVDLDERDYVIGTKAKVLVDRLVEVLGAEGHGRYEGAEARARRRKAWTRIWKEMGIVRAEETVRNAVLECVLGWDEERRERRKGSRRLSE